MRVLALLFLTLCLCTQVVHGQWLRCNFAADTNVSIVLTNIGCVDDTSANRTCLRDNYPGLPITFGECVINDNPPQRGYKANIRVYENASFDSTPEIDFQERYDSNGYVFSDWINDMFFVYWNDTGLNDTFNNDSIPFQPSLELDAVGYSLERFRAPVEEHEVEILVGNYITRLAYEGGDPTIQVVIGDDSSLNKTVLYAGWGHSYTNRFVVNWTEVIPVRVYGPDACIDYDLPLWNGYINASHVWNETFIGFFGDYVNREIFAVYGRVTNYTVQLENTQYTVCNFVNELVNGTLTGEPESRNISLQLGAGIGADLSCGILKKDIYSDIVPYGTCVVMNNGPAPKTVVRKILWLNDSSLITNNTDPNLNITDPNFNITDGNLTSNLTSVPGFILFNDTLGVGVRTARTYADGTDFFIAYYVDHYHELDNFTDDYTVEFPRDDTFLGYETFCMLNGTECDFTNETSINSTFTPLDGYQTYIIGTYASNWVNLTSENSTYVTVSFNNTWWTVCPVSTYDFRSCVITVPNTLDVWNITLYTDPCYMNPDNCSSFYVDSTLCNFGNASVGLVAWYGDWSSQVFVTTYNQYGVWWNITEPMILSNSTDNSTDESSSSSSSTGGFDFSSSSTGIDLSSSSTGGLDLSSSSSTGGGA